MSSVVELLNSRRGPQIAVLALMSIGFAGCSADMQTRLSENPFKDNSRSSQFGWQRDATGSVNAPRQETPQYQQPQYQQPQYEAPQYQRPPYQPQAQYQSQPLPPPISAPQTYVSSAPVAGGGKGVGTYAPSRPSTNYAQQHSGSNRDDCEHRAAVGRRCARCDRFGERHEDYRRHQ